MVLFNRSKPNKPERNILFRVYDYTMFKDSNTFVFCIHPSSACLSCGLIWHYMQEVIA